MVLEEHHIKYGFVVEVEEGKLVLRHNERLLAIIDTVDILSAHTMRKYADEYIIRRLNGGQD